MVYSACDYASFEEFEQARKRFFERASVEEQIANYIRAVHDEFLRAKAEHEEMCRQGEHGWQVVLDGGRAYRVCWWCGKGESLRQKVCPLCELRYYITEDETERGCPECM